MMTPEEEMIFAENKKNLDECRKTILELNNALIQKRAEAELMRTGLAQSMESGKAAILKMDDLIDEVIRNILEVVKEYSELDTFGWGEMEEKIIECRPLRIKR